MPGGIGAALNIGGSIINAVGGKQATDDIVGSINEAQEEIRGAVERNDELLTPFSEAGQRGLDRFEKGLNVGIADIINGIEDNPAFQFQKEQGIDAIQGAASSVGNLLSGRTLEALNEFGQGLASNQIDKEFNRNQTRLGDFFNLSQIGFNANANRGSTGIVGARSIGDLLVDRGNAEADNKLNITDSINGVISGIGSFF